MCGIFGYVGKRNGVKIALDGLKKLEYRGYDSSGIAGIVDGKFECYKEPGKISALESHMKDFSSTIAVAHVRWATHGIVTKENAHPLFDEKKTVAVVHNGIIENHQAIRDRLKKEGIRFETETDTEVIPKLIAKLYEGDFLKAVQQAVLLLHGAYAIAVLHKNHPNQIVVAQNGCPLVIGVGSQECFISSDPNALLHNTREVLFLSDREVADIRDNQVSIYDESLERVSKKTEQLLHDIEEVSKGSFEHYTLKEIFEQPQTLCNALLGRYVQEYGTVELEGLVDRNGSSIDFQAIKRILICACGTSWNAGYVASYLLEDLARIPCSVEIASEFRYKNAFVPEGTFAIVISQSGETADTIAAMRELKARGVSVMAICNVQGSTIAREADSCLFLRAGPEVGVCSTKAFTSQVALLFLFTIHLARQRQQMSKTQAQEFLQALHELPNQVQEVLDMASMIQQIAKKYSTYNDFFYLGRRYMYPSSLEGALKLKEISYVNANGYPAGEMKHGPIALINETCPTVALCADTLTYDKMLSNVMEVKARKGKVVAIVPKSMKGLDGIADDMIMVPDAPDELSPILVAVACQLFAYFVAKERGAEIDKPRNLAKSVTVE